MKYIDLGLIDFQKAWAFQSGLFEINVHAKLNNEKTENTLIFCEHPHTITVGKNGNNSNLLYPSDYLNEKGVALYKIDRGGDITYHGLGQQVVYPIFDLESFHIGLKQYIWNLEEVMIRFLSLYGISGQRCNGAAGVWLDVEVPQRTRKIGAIGVRCSRYITMHGFALNLNTDLSYFSLINPCGFADRGVTSLEKESGEKIDTEQAKLQLRKLFGEIFFVP